MAFDPATAKPLNFDPGTAKQDEEKPSLLQTVDKLSQYATPGGMFAKIMHKSGEMMDRAAYKAGEKVTDVTGSPGAGYAANVALQTVPALIGGGGGKVLGSPVVEGAAQRLMSSAVKPSTESLRTGRATKAIQTMLDEGINATEGGMLKVRSELDKLREEVKKVIANSPAEIDRSKVAQELFSVLNRAYKQATPKGDIAKVTQAFDEFMSHPLISGDKIPVQLAQDMKKAGNRKLEGEYGQMGSADIESQKAIIRGLKEGIEKAEPAIGPLNQRMATLLNVLKTAERRALMESNKNPAGLTLLAENPYAASAFMFDRSALAKSLAARLLHANRGTLSTGGGGTLGAMLGAYSGQEPE